MAIYQVLVTRDIKANVCSMPMYFLHLGQAIKAFQDECRNPRKDTDIAKHPEDFELLHIAEYSDTEACFLTRDGEPAEDTKRWGNRQLAAGVNFKEP